MTSGARYSGVPHNVYVSPVRVSVSLQSQEARLTILYFLCEPKVDQLKVTFGVNEDVFWFQVAVCNALALVQEF